MQESDSDGEALTYTDGANDPKPKRPKLELDESCYIEQPSPESYIIQISDDEDCVEIISENKVRYPLVID